MFMWNNSGGSIYFKTRLALPGKVLIRFYVNWGRIEEKIHMDNKA